MPDSGPKGVQPMRIAIFLYDGMTALDAIGPYDVLRQLPGAEVVFVGDTAGVKRTEEQPLGLVADRGLGEVQAADILVLPGGFGQERVMREPRTLEWIRTIHATTQWTTSVCTGSLILAAAGLLRGRRRTGPSSSSCASSAPSRWPSVWSSKGRSSPPPESRPGSTWPSGSLPVWAATTSRAASSSASSTTRRHPSTPARRAR